LEQRIAEWIKSEVLLKIKSLDFDNRLEMHDKVVEQTNNQKIDAQTSISELEPDESTDKNVKGSLICEEIPLREKIHNAHLEKVSTDTPELSLDQNAPFNSIETPDIPSELVDTRNITEYSLAKSMIVQEIDNLRSQIVAELSDQFESSIVSPAEAYAILDESVPFSLTASSMEITDVSSIDKSQNKQDLIDTTQPKNGLDTVSLAINDDLLNDVYIDLLKMALPELLFPLLHEVIIEEKNLNNLKLNENIIQLEKNNDEVDQIRLEIQDIKREVLEELKKENKRIEELERSSKEIFNQRMTLHCDLDPIMAANPKDVDNGEETSKKTEKNKKPENTEDGDTSRASAELSNSSVITPVKINLMKVFRSQQ
jgi:hypothetical protein